jgi:hypothetical protein
MPHSRAKADGAQAIASRSSYNRLGSIGKPITKVYNGQEIQLCGKPCIKTFDANPIKDMTEPK